MSLTAELIDEFLAKHEVQEAPAVRPIATLGPDAGSYTYEKLGEWLGLVADANPGFSYERSRTSKGDGFRISCPGDTGWADGAQHSEQGSNFLTGSAVVWVDNGHPRFSCRHAHCSEGAAGGKKTWKHLVQALDMGGNFQRRVLTGVISLGISTSASLVSQEQTEEGYPIVDHSEDSRTVTTTAEEGPFVENIPEREAEPSDALRYPTEVWDGTEYAEFARRGTEGNFIPPEFFIESLKTYVGAIAGNNMLISNERSGRARFYTILLAGPGTGKNTAIDCTHEFFRRQHKDLVIGDWPADALVWYPQHKIETRMWKKIGTCRMKMSSASGLARSLPRLGKKGEICNSPQERLIVVYTELAEMFEKLGIEGSGATMMSALCDLYDGEEFVVPALADNDSFGGHLMMSILAGIQPRKWDIVCAGKGIEGSGFDERINLIPTTNTKTVASLSDPDFSDFKEPFIERLMTLDKEPYVVKATTDAKRVANDEYQKLKPKDEDGTSAGRLNVLAWRNALHYSWLTRAALVDVDAIQRGMSLARYQLEVRKLYKPLTGDNATARAANAILRILEKTPIGSDTKLRDLERASHADRLGATFDSALTLLANRGRIVQHEQDVATGGGSKKIRFIRRLE